MSRALDSDKRCQFHLDLHWQRATKAGPEKTGPFIRLHSMAETLGELIGGYTAGLRG